MLKYLRYQEERDVLFVFGAGASIADGSPLQRDLLPQIFSLETELPNINVVKDFIRKNFFIEEGEKYYPSLESVFGYLDYFISQKESLGGLYNTIELISIKENLIRLIHYVISQSNKSKGVYKKFWEIIDRNNRNISVITLNYDTLLDESFDFLYHSRSFIDYSINLMNYEQYEQVDAFDWWINPREPVDIEEQSDVVPIKILKVHGSLNWKYCNCCNQVLLTPWSTEISLESEGFKGTARCGCDMQNTEPIDLKCPNDGTRFDTFIIPPSHIKNLKHPTITKIFDEASLEIRKAKKIIFVGYSFPEADVHIKAMFKKNLFKSPQIIVIDPYLNQTTVRNYKTLNENAAFVRMSFEDFVEDHLTEELSL